MLTGVTAIAADDIWAVGTSTRSGQVARPLTEHWDGSRWRVVTAPNPAGGFNTLVGVSAASATSVWAVGWFGAATQTPLTERWNGTRWSRVTTPGITTNGTLLGVQALSATDVWAAGQTERAIPAALIAHWGGSAWTRTTGGAAAGANLSLYDTDGTWAVGSSMALGTASVATSLLRSGSNWARVAPVTPGSGDVLNAVDEIPGNPDAWAVGSTLQGNRVRTLIERACT